MKTSRAEPPKFIYYWENKKQDQKINLEIQKIWVWEEDQNAAPCRKPLVYQQPQRVAPHLLKALPVPIRYNPQDLQLIEKTWNHSGNYKGSHTSRGDQHTYWYLQCLWQIEVDNDLLSQLGNCRNIVRFQISSKIGSW